MAVKRMTIALEKKKETPGTIQYAEVPDEGGKYADGLFDAPAVGTQYVKKYAAARLGNPARIIITIEAAE
jgi:hypothetical protein